jgi:hypothetical protein
VCGKVSYYLSEMNGMNRIYNRVLDKKTFNLAQKNIFSPATLVKVLEKIIKLKI